MTTTLREVEDAPPNPRRRSKAAASIDADLVSIDVELPSGSKKTLRFKSLTTLPMGIVRRTRDNTVEQMWVVFEWAFTADDLAIFDELPYTKVYEILRQMQEASKIELGESPASSES